MPLLLIQSYRLALAARPSESQLKASGECLGLNSGQASPRCWKDRRLCTRQCSVNSGCEHTHTHPDVPCGIAVKGGLKHNGEGREPHTWNILGFHQF